MTRSQASQPHTTKPDPLFAPFSKNDETIWLLDFEEGIIRVAAYWTKLLPRAALAKKLHQAVRLARITLDRATA